jgi:hypothetical protein
MSNDEDLLTLLVQLGKEFFNQLLLEYFNSLKYVVVALQPTSGRIALLIYSQLLIYYSLTSWQYILGFQFTLQLRDKSITL